MFLSKYYINVFDTNRKFRSKSWNVRSVSRNGRSVSWNVHSVSRNETFCLD